MFSGARPTLSASSGCGMGGMFHVKRGCGFGCGWWVDASRGWPRCPTVDSGARAGSQDASVNSAGDTGVGEQPVGAHKSQPLGRP